MPVYVKKNGGRNERETEFDTDGDRNARAFVRRSRRFQNSPIMGLFAFPARRVLMFDNGRVSLYKDMKVASNG